MSVEETWLLSPSSPELLSGLGSGSQKLTTNLSEAGWQLQTVKGAGAAKACWSQTVKLTEYKVTGVGLDPEKPGEVSE